MGSDNDSNPPETPSPGGSLPDFRSPTSDELFSTVYDELRKIAHRLFAGERRGHTLQPTEIVNEAYLKLAGQERARWKSRTHFLAVSAQAMRRLLIDHARKRGAAKRGAARTTLELLEIDGPASVPEIDIDDMLQVNEAIEKLAGYDERQALIVTLRFFGGLTVKEVAEALGLSARTVAMDWRHAKAWLELEMTGESP